MTLERAMVVQSVLEGKIGSEYATVDEIAQACSALIDQVIANDMQENLERQDVTVFEHAWQYHRPN